jgi:hypothetical protein
MPFSDPDSDHAERRSHPRVSLKAFGYNHVCAFIRSGRRHAASLVDLSPGGARLALLDDRPPIAVRDPITLDLALPAATEDLSAVAGAVRWIGNGDFGVSFVRELALGNIDLQKLLER